MLTALAVADARAIADAARKRSRDERAMVEYLGIGRGGNAPPRDLGSVRIVKATAIDLAAFESDERQQLRDALARLTVEARREFIALVWFAKSPSLSFAAALRRAQRIPADAQLGYLLSRRLERDVPLGLEKLGYR